MSLICEITYQALKIEVTILFGESIRGGRVTAELAQQLLRRMVSTRLPLPWPSVTQHGQVVTSVFIRLILRRLVLSHERRSYATSTIFVLCRCGGPDSK